MINKVKKPLLVILITISMIPVNAQENDSLYYFSGQVLSEGLNNPISFAHIINRDRRWGVSADSLGFFHIWVKPSDSLNVSAIGFDYLQYGINQTYSDSVIKIYLNPRIYDIPEASVYYLGTYKEFEYKVLNLKLPESNFNPQFEKIIKHVEPPLFNKPQITSPVSLIYALFSKDAKNIYKYIELKKEAEITNKVRLRYNAQVVSNLTGLNEEESYKLMDFCAFENRYILNIDEYRLYAEILKRHEEFKKNKEDSIKKE